MNSKSTFENFFRTEYFFILILTIGIFLRIWGLPNHGIMFPDAGKDLLVALHTVETKTLPLKGIATSVPIFHQGPLMIWYLAFLLWIGQMNLTVVYIGSALIGILAIVFLYYFMEKAKLPHKGNLLAALMLACSPLAVAHSRMPFMTVPIPICTLLFLWSLLRLMEKKKHAVIMAGLAFAVLIQFELVLIPAGFAIPLILWKTKNFSLRSLLLIGVGGTVGGATFFAQWQNALTWLQQSHSSIGEKLHRMIDKFPETLTNFQLYFTRFWSVDRPEIFVIAFAIVLFSFLIIWKKRKELPLIIQLNLLLIVLSTVPFIARGSPSEAYMPHYFVLLPMLVGYALSFVKASQIQLFAITTVIAISLWNVVDIPRNNFFVLPTHTEFHYSVSVEERMEVVDTIKHIQKGNPYRLRTTDPSNQYASYLDPYRFLGKLIDTPEQPDHPQTRFVFIEQKQSELDHYPNAYIIEFPSVKIIKIIE